MTSKGAGQETRGDVQVERGDRFTGTAGRPGKRERSWSQPRLRRSGALVQAQAGRQSHLRGQLEQHEGAKERTRNMQVWFGVRIRNREAELGSPRGGRRGGWERSSARVGGWSGLTSISADEEHVSLALYLANDWLSSDGALLRGVDHVDGLLHFAKDHVHVPVVRLRTPQPGSVSRGGRKKRRGRIWHTCRIPLSSRSPRSLTNTRSERDTRIRSNGSTGALPSGQTRTTTSQLSRLARRSRGWSGLPGMVDRAVGLGWVVELLA